MANQPSPTVEELQLRKRARRRLIGAVTLVALMVTILPMVLDDEPKPVGSDIAINIPSQQATDLPLPPAQPSARVEQPPARPTEPAAPTQALAAAPEEPPALPKPTPPKPQSPPPKKPEKPPAKPVEKPAKPVEKSEKPAEKPAKPAEKPAEKPKVVSETPKEKPAEAKPSETPRAATPHPVGPHVVLLGAFSSEVNAKQRQAKLKELGIKFYSEKIKSPAGDKFAVRAGPYPDRQEAEHVLAKLKGAGIQDGMVAEKK
jgi:DedD protein